MEKKKTLRCRRTCNSIGRYFGPSGAHCRTLPTNYQQYDQIITSNISSTALCNNVEISNHPIQFISDATTLGRNPALMTIFFLVIFIGNEDFYPSFFSPTIDFSSVNLRS